MVECHDLTDTVMLKSQDTMLCTETNTGKINADSRMPAIIWNFHCRELPCQPKASNP